MKKRIVRKRKRINKNIGGASRPRKAKSTPVECESEECRALVEYERGEIVNGLGGEPEGESAAQTADDTPESRGGQSDSVKRGDVLRLVCGFVVTFSLFCAVVLACFAFAVATEYGADEDAIDADAQPSESESEEGKVIFVRPDDDGSGRLTAPEIYERCVRSTVTVTARASQSMGGESIGSGFVVNANGYIVSAAHTVNGADSIAVTLYDGREYEAQLSAIDSLSDIALLKIDETNLSAVELGSSDGLLAGERIYTIGTPAAVEYAGTLSAGEIAAGERMLPVYREGVRVLEKTVKVIQISASVGKGNSGCPVFDEYGRAVGMVTMGLGEDYGGIGFALPSDGIAPVIREMLAGKEISDEIRAGVVLLPARLGVKGESAELGGTYGYRIEMIEEGAAAASALRVGDLIVQIDNKIITNETDISEALAKKTKGDTARVTVVRNSQRLSFTVTLGK